MEVMNPILAEKDAREVFAMMNESPEHPVTDRARVTAVNLAHALLFTDRFDEAMKLYLGVKDIPESKDKTFANDIRNDFAVFRKLGYDVSRGKRSEMCQVGKAVDDPYYANIDCGGTG